MSEDILDPLAYRKRLYIVNILIVSVSQHDSENIELIVSASRIEPAAQVRIEIIFFLILFEITEHGTVIHVVTEDNIVGIGKIFRVVCLKIDRTGNACLAVDILGGIFKVIFALNDRIVDISIVDSDPASGILIDFFKSCKAVLIVIRSASVAIILTLASIVGINRNGFELF